MGKRDEIDSVADLFDDQLIGMLKKRLHVQVEVERTQTGITVLVKLVDKKTKEVIVQGQGAASSRGYD